jgi:regulation of enolase protein 1 (concanavalin A-like superfamily)
LRNRIVCTRVALFLTLLVIAPRTSSAQQSVPSPWTAQDIGQPAPAGSTSFNQGTFTIAAGGTDIWGSSDQFRFVYQQVSGDVEIIARVNSLSLVNEWAKSGVMIRGSLSANSAHAFALVSAAGGAAFQRRTTSGNSSTHGDGPFASAPYWVRLVRAGTRVTAYGSPDGRSWTTMGDDTIALGATAYVGLAVTSHSNGVLAVSDISQVSISSGSLPSAIQTQDIGSPALGGNTSFAAGTYTITAGGLDIWDTSDQFRYTYQQVSGDVDVVARVASLTAADPWSKAAVMIRESLAPDSRFAMAVVSAQSGYSLQWRADTSGFADWTPGGTGAAPQWVRVVRTGSQFQAFRSTDGQAWTLMGTNTIPMGSAAYVGIAVTSHNPAVRTTAVVEQFSVERPQSDPNQAPLVTLTQPANGAQYAPGAAIPLAATASDPENRLSRVEFFSGSDRVGSDQTSPYSASWSTTAAGTYSLYAVAFDADGGSATSNMSTINIVAVSAPPRLVIFGASVDHDTLVSSYRLDIFAAGANPNTATRLTFSDLGKPGRDGAGDITVDRGSFLSALASGTYVATVSAVGPGGEGRGAPVTFTR